MSQLPATTSSGLLPNHAAALAYLFGPLTGLLFIIIEKENRFVRFHAAQSIVIGLMVVAASVVLSIVNAILSIVPIIGWLVGLLLSLVFAFVILAGWFFLMYRAYQGVELEVPVASTYARKLLAVPAA